MEISVSTSSIITSGSSNADGPRILQVFNKLNNQQHLTLTWNRSWFANVVTDLMTRKLGLVREVHWNWPDPLSNLLGYNGQQLVLQDCLYRSSLSWWWWWKCFRNRDGFKYLAFSDLDERLLPGHLLFYYYFLIGHLPRQQCRLSTCSLFGLRQAG